MNMEWVESALRAAPPDEPHYAGDISASLRIRASEKVGEDASGALAVVAISPRRTKPMKIILVAAAAALVLLAANAVVARRQPHSAATRPSVANSSSLYAELVGRWVGPTPDALTTPNASAAAFVVFDGDRIALQYLAGGIVTDFSSRVEVIDDGHLRLTLVDRIGRCAAGAIGEYRWSLSPKATTLTFEAITDECATRAASFAGNWTHTACPVRGGDCLGPLEAGRYASVDFDPFGTDSYGEVEYDVIDDWASTVDDKSRLTLLPPDGDETGVHGLYLFADVAATNGDCTSTLAAGEGSPAIASSIANVAGLSVSTSTSTVGTYRAQVVDVSTTVPLRCGGDVVLLTSRLDESIGWTFAVSDGQRLRVLLIELPENRTTAIIVASDRSEAEYEQLLAAATDVINSFEFFATP